MDRLAGDRRFPRASERPRRNVLVPLLLVALFGSVATFFGVRARVGAKSAPSATAEYHRESEAPPYAVRTYSPSGSPLVDRTLVPVAPPPGAPEPPTDPQTRFQELKQQSDPRETVAKVMRELQGSGPSNGLLESKVFELLQSWQRSTPFGSKVTFNDFKCFASGCSVGITTDSFSSWQQASTEFQRSEQFLSWTGPKFLSGPITAQSENSNRIDATWVLYR